MIQDYDTWEKKFEELYDELYDDDDGFLYSKESLDDYYRDNKNPIQALADLLELEFCEKYNLYPEFVDEQ